MKLQANHIVALLASITLIFGCSKYRSNELSYVEYHAITLEITDAPFPLDIIDEANVTITKAEIRAKEFTFEDDTNEKNITLFEGELTTNLLELTNGMTQFLGEAEVPAGTYDLIRMYVSDASIKLMDGTVHNLKIPSGEQTGIKIFIAPHIVTNADQSTPILIDIDVSKSFVLKGNIDTLAGINGFNFKPVARAVNLLQTGTLIGTVINEETGMAIADAEITVRNNDMEYTTTFANTNGEYTVLGLPEGDYNVRVEANGFAALEREVTITESETVTQDFELISE